MTAPATREALFEAIANEIGWGSTPDDVQSFVEAMEAQGVVFTATTATKAMIAAAGAEAKVGIAQAIEAAIAANPYAPPAAKA